MQAARPSPIAAPLPRLALGAVLGLALLLVLGRPLVTNDYLVYVAMGRQMLAQGALLDCDPFTFTVGGAPFLHASWGWSLLCALLHRATGYQGIRALVGLCTLLTLVGVHAAARRAGAGPRAAAVAVLYAWLLLLQNLGPRSQILVYPLFVGLVALLARPPRPAWGLAAGLAAGCLWTQVHGSFPIPILYAGALSLGSALSARSARAALPAGAVALGLLGGTLLGPWGPAIWTYVWTNGAVPRERGIAEWAAPALGSFAGLRLLAATLLWAALLARRPRALGPGDWLLVLGFLAMAAGATRVVAWFGLATALPLARLLPADGPAPPATPRARALLAGLGAAWVALLAVGVPRAVPLAADTPAALAEALAVEPVQGRVFASMEHAGYLAWRFHEPAPPRGRMARPTFVDMRVWIFPDEVWDEFAALAEARPGWQERLDAWQVQHLLLAPGRVGEALLAAARASPRWDLVAEDGSGALLRRRAAVDGAGPGS